MIVSNIVRSLVVSAVVAPVLSLGLSLPAGAAAADTCEGTLWECFVKKAEEDAAKLSAAPTSAPVVGETLSSPSSDY